jgi:hypothetical protein
VLSEEKFNKLKEINKKYGYGSWTLGPKNESRKSDPKNKDVSDTKNKDVSFFDEEDDSFCSSSEAVKPIANNATTKIVR